MNFYSLHLLFDEMAGELEGYVDLVAERITALGGFAMGTARVAATDSILPEYPFDIQEGQDHLTYSPFLKKGDSPSLTALDY
jgi:starvation-inducible DNA-binding protein